MWLCRVYTAYLFDGHAQNFVFQAGGQGLPNAGLLQFKVEEHESTKQRKGIASTERQTHRAAPKEERQSRIEGGKSENDRERETETER